MYISYISSLPQHVIFLWKYNRNFKCHTSWWAYQCNQNTPTLCMLSHELLRIFWFAVEQRVEPRKNFAYPYPKTWLGWWVSAYSTNHIFTICSRYIFADYLWHIFTICCRYMYCWFTLHILHQYHLHAECMHWRKATFWDGSLLRISNLKDLIDDETIKHTIVYQVTGIPATTDPVFLSLRQCQLKI